MGRCETATASIGLKILLSNLVSQLNENNMTLITQMLHRGFIEDENDYFNEVYGRIVGRDTLPENWLERKEWLTQKFTINGSYNGLDRTTPTLENGCLFDKYLLVPLKTILSLDRWGYDRDGTNSISRPIDFDLSVNIEKCKYNDIQGTEIVFLLGKHSE